MGRSVGRDYDAKRDAMLRGAARVFAAEGYGQTTVARVAEACGMSKGLLYHYYDGKESLLFGILDTHLRALRDRVCGLSFDTDDPVAQLRAIVGELLAAYEGADAEHAVQLSALAALPPDRQKALRAHQVDLVRFVRARIERMAPSLAADPRRQHAVTMSVFAMVNWHFQWDGRAGPAERAAYADVVTDLVAGGLPAVRDRARPS